MKLIKQIREERELLHKMIEHLAEEVWDNVFTARSVCDDLSNMVRISAAHLLTLTRVGVMLAYALAGILVLVVKLFRRKL